LKVSCQKLAAVAQVPVPVPVHAPVQRNENRWRLYFQNNESLFKNYFEPIT